MLWLLTRDLCKMETLKSFDMPLFRTQGVVSDLNSAAGIADGGVIWGFLSFLPFIAEDCFHRNLDYPLQAVLNLRALSRCRLGTATTEVPETT